MTLRKLGAAIGDVLTEVCGVTMRSSRVERGWSEKRMALRVGLPVHHWVLFEEGELSIPVRHMFRALRVFVGEAEPGLPRGYLPWPKESRAQLRDEAIQRALGRLLAMVV